MSTVDPVLTVSFKDYWEHDNMLSSQVYDYWTVQSLSSYNTACEYTPREHDSHFVLNSQTHKLQVTTVGQTTTRYVWEMLS